MSGERKPKVFICQQSTDKNVLPALKYGDLQKVFNADDDLLLDQARLLLKAGRVLHKFNPDLDFVMPIGSPIAIIMVALVLGARGHRRVQVLKWDQQEKMYHVIVVDMDNAVSEALSER